MGDARSALQHAGFEMLVLLLNELDLLVLPQSVCFLVVSVSLELALVALVLGNINTRSSSLLGGRIEGEWRVRGGRWAERRLLVVSGSFSLFWKGNTDHAESIGSR